MELHVLHKYNSETTGLRYDPGWGEWTKKKEQNLPHCNKS